MWKACSGQPGCHPAWPAPGAQILYWAFLGFALSEQPLPRVRQAAVLDELLAVAAR
jgi:hypothetical protein